MNLLDLSKQEISLSAKDVGLGFGVIYPIIGFKAENVVSISESNDFKGAFFRSWLLAGSFLLLLEETMKNFRLKWLTNYKI